MKQVMMVKFDSPKWRKVDEYKVANPFIDVGFRQVKDVVDLRVFDLLNISRINNNRAEEMLLCIYHLLQPDRRIDEGIYNDEIDQYFSYREWKKKHQPLSGLTGREIVAAENRRREDEMYNNEYNHRLAKAIVARIVSAIQEAEKQWQKELEEWKRTHPIESNVEDDEDDIF